MGARCEVRETTNFVHASRGWHEVTITDYVTGHQTNALAETYEEAERQAWERLKTLQGTAATPRAI